MVIQRNTPTRNRKKVGTPKKRPKKSSKLAPQQALGFFLQTTRMAQLLFEAERGSQVSLEVLEDVAYIKETGRILASQTKSATGKKNPIADHSIELWKCFANWIEDVKDGRLSSSKTTFEIYISSPREGLIVEMFSKAKTTEKAIAALLNAKAILFPKSNKRSSTVAANVKPFVDAVFAADQTVTADIIKNFQLTVEDGSPRQKLKTIASRFLKVFKSEDQEKILQSVEGWLKDKVDVYLERRRPAIVPTDDFWAFVQSFVQKFIFNRLLVGLAAEPSKDQIEGEELKTYVRQLGFIGCPIEIKLNAVRDYLKAAADRTYWTESSIVNDTSFDSLSDDLQNFWQHKRLQGSILHRDRIPSEQGQLLLTECLVYKPLLEGQQVEQYFANGSFHSLSQDEIIGWHPEFKNLLVQTGGA
jgi:hypothetical protein